MAMFVGTAQQLTALPLGSSTHSEYFRGVSLNTLLVEPPLTIHGFMLETLAQTHCLGVTVVAFAFVRACMFARTCVRVCVCVCACVCCRGHGQTRMNVTKNIRKNILRTR